MCYLRNIFKISQNLEEKMLPKVKTKFFSRFLIFSMVVGITFPALLFIKVNFKTTLFTLEYLERLKTPMQHYFL